MKLLLSQHVTNMVGTGENNLMQGKIINSLSLNRNYKIQENNSSYNTHQVPNDIKFHGWIIDFGATDHMTYKKSNLINKRVTLKQDIINANGDVHPIADTSDVKISPKITLNNSLLVPSLSTKLISVGQLTHDLNCAAIMLSNYCVFQDLLMKEIIDHGIKRSGLYYLDELKTGRMCLTGSVVKDRENEVML
jgi:hypothetical protein